MLIQVEIVKHDGVHGHELHRADVGTWTASAGRMPDGGAEQRQRRRGEDGPSQQTRAFISQVDPVAA